MQRLPPLCGAIPLNLVEVAWFSIVMDMEEPFLFQIALKNSLS